ncbi:MAG: tRNA pseudouridine(38-40) synthase TruA [Planctomycetes bacterium]|nr:tRNA pseudouridine(38-40) synthase TruA [Planctomycetota bacterium]MCP4770276.1 tRNA pseudouridine(38-40) synthase TruA [Planctomycetota bacterium]MCP4861450.1 tRNA pseudouridine(38-40) synthase TruA [Planctomycetota bacterium]
MTKDPAADFVAPRRVAMIVKYDGGAFCGFQRQPGFRTVQEELETAWTAVSGESQVVHGSGRTDSGVHAFGQVVHLPAVKRLSADKIVRAMNAYLPDDLAVRCAAEAPPGFHACQSAVGKHYVYFAATGSERPVLQRGKVAWIRRPLDMDAMRQALPALIGTHDFEAFAAAGRSTTTTIRTITSAHIKPMRGGLAFHFRGKGFLYRQVRNMVGTLLEVGYGKRGPQWVTQVRDGRDRQRAGATAAAEGLYLWRVFYQPDPFTGLCQD